MENCKNCKYVKEDGCFDETYYACAITNCCINFPRLMGGSKKCVCYRRAEKKKNKFQKKLYILSYLLKNNQK